MKTRLFSDSQILISRKGWVLGFAGMCLYDMATNPMIWSFSSENFDDYNKDRTKLLEKIKKDSAYNV